MPTTPEQIDLWRGSPSEHGRLEFKEAKTQFDNNKLHEYCVALANEGGGYLVLGVADKPPRAVVGTQAFNAPVAMATKLFQILGFRVDVEEVAHPDGRVVVFHIPSRPRGSAHHLDGKYLMRTGESLVPMSQDQLRRIFAEGQPDWLEEPSRSGLDPQQVIDLLDTQAFFELIKLPHPTERAGVLERLANERLVDEEQGRYSIRRLGAILLAKRLDDFPDLARKAPRVVVYSGTSKLENSSRSDGNQRLCGGVPRVGPLHHGSTATERGNRGRASKGSEARSRGRCSRARCERIGAPGSRDRRCICDGRDLRQPR